MDARFARVRASPEEQVRSTGRHDDRTAGEEVSLVDEVFGRLSSSATLMMELFPFLLYRLAVYTIFGVVILAYWIGALMLWFLVSALNETAALLVLLVAFCGNFGLVYLARDYLLYMVKAGYVAVVTEMVTRGKLPAGMSQTEFAKQEVTSRFKQASALAVVDALVRGAIRSFNRTLEDLASWVPIPGVDKLAHAVGAVISLAAGTIDEAILALSFARKEQNVWASARDGLLLYAQNWKPILKVAAAVVLIDWICTATLGVMLLLVIGGPAAVILTRFPTLRLLALIVPLLLAYMIRMAFIEPMAVTAVLITFLQCVKGQQPDPAWDEKLSQVSKQFQELKSKAAAAVA
jgi:hypothetical protein